MHASNAPIPGSISRLAFGDQAPAGDDFRLDAQFAEHVGYRTGIADTVVDNAYLSHGIVPTLPIQIVFATTS